MNKSFHRSRMLFAAMSAILSRDWSPLKKSMEIDKLPAYVSRGKGGKSAHKTGHKHMAYVRAQARRAA